MNEELKAAAERLRNRQGKASDIDLLLAGVLEVLGYRK